MQSKLRVLTSLVSSAHNLCKQIGPRSGTTKCLHDLDPIFSTLRWYIPERIFQKKLNDFEKSQQMTKKARKNSHKELKVSSMLSVSCDNS